MPADLKITSAMLLEGALFFAVLDAFYVPLLVWKVSGQAFRRMRWAIACAAACIWYGIWAWAIGNFWDTVYIYVFPAWAQVWAPRIAFAAAAVIGVGLWRLGLR